MGPMIKKLVSWLYLKIVYLPTLKAKIEAGNPGVKVTCRGRLADTDLEAQSAYNYELENRIIRQAWFERERIPDVRLH